MVSNIITSGGIATIIIIGMGILSFLIFLERILALHRAQINVKDFLNGIFNILRQGNRSEAIMICEETPGPSASLVKTAIMHFSDSPEEYKKAIYESGVEQLSRMEKNFAIVSLIAQVAPLIGLFGTIVGMIEYALVIKEAPFVVRMGEITSAVLMASISAAFGLAVSVLSSVEYNLLAFKIDRFARDMEHIASEMALFINNLKGS